MNSQKGPAERVRTTDTDFSEMLQAAEQVSDPTITNKILDRWARIKAWYQYNNSKDFQVLQQLDHEKARRHMDLFLPQSDSEEMNSEDDTVIGDVNITTNKQAANGLPMLASAIGGAVLALAAGGGAAYYFANQDKQVNLVNERPPSAVKIYREPGANEESNE